jgi:hypothetical protein
VKKAPQQGIVVKKVHRIDSVVQAINSCAKGEVFTKDIIANKADSFYMEQNGVSNMSESKGNTRRTILTAISFGLVTEVENGYVRN